MQTRRIVSGYFTLQALGVFAWWLLLWMQPSSIRWFQPRGWPSEVLTSFWLADLLLIGCGSAVAALGVWRGRDWASMSVWIVAVVCWYPTLVCFGTSIGTDEAWVASAMMFSMAGLALAMATIQGTRNHATATFRVTSMSLFGSVVATLGQTLIFWVTFLWILPKGIVELQSSFGWNTFFHPLQTPLSSTLFVLASSLGLFSSMTMAIQGRGTPLPTATAPQLVVSGPYRFVRNPMAVAGILQGVAVGWLLGSVPVILYALAGIPVWHIFVRPSEEHDLHNRFGASYQQYQQHIRVWLPSWRGFATGEPSSIDSPNSRIKNH